MNFCELLAVAFGVSLDAFAVSVGGAMHCSGSSWKSACSAALFFGGFQFLMPVAGFFAAARLAGFVEEYDHWCAFVLLAAVGGKMIFEGLRGEKEKTAPAVCRSDFFTPVNLLIPAVATSLDALAVGASLAFAGNDVWTPAGAMGVVTGAVSFIGVKLGNRLKSFGREGLMSAAGGAVILLIGVKILWEHCR